MTDLQAGLLRGPRFNPDEAMAAAVAAEERAAAGDTDKNWADHLIHGEPVEEEGQGQTSTGRRVPLPGDARPHSPFQGFLLDLAEALEEGADTGEGRTELELSLHYLDRATGQERASLCHKLKLSSEECLRRGLPDLEALALDYAMAKGPWGSYRWNIRGWVKGEQSFSTSQRINLMEPPGWKPRDEPKAEPTAPAAPDPMAQLTQTLGLARTMREALGLGGGSGADGAAVMAADMKARFEMSEAHRKEIDRLREDHRKEIDRLRDKVTELERQLQEKDFELRSQPASEDAGPLDKFLGKLEPGTVNGLLGAFAAKMMQEGAKPKPAPAKVPARTREELKPRPAANVQPLQRPAAHPEPKRAEAVAAVHLLAEASEVEGDGTEQDDAIRTHLQRLAEAGMAEGPLGAWWATITSPADPAQAGGPSWLDYAAHRLEASEEEGEGEATDTQHEPEGEPMDFEALKAQLIARIEEGATDDAILTELAATLSPEHLRSLRDLVGNVPAMLLGAALGVPQHQARLTGLRARLLEA